MPFEIFSEEESTKLIGHAKVSKKYDDSLMYLINKMNYGVHGEKGWLGKLRACAEEVKMDDERDILLSSLLRHVGTAKTLQQNPAGELTEGVLPPQYERFIEKSGDFLGIKKKESEDRKEVTDRTGGVASGITVEMHTMSYQRFWDDYLRNILIAFMQDLSDKNAASRNHLTKPIIYLLARLKTLVRQEKLFRSASYPNILESDIQKSILKIKTDQPDVFGLNEAEDTFMKDRQNVIVKRLQEIVLLRKKFESNPLFARYVHVHPDVLVQFAQMLDYSCHYIAEMAKKGLFSKTISKDDAAVLAILRQKRREIAVVMAFQEELSMKYGCGDFIQVLHSLLQNKKTDFLPTQAFYDFVESHPVAIASYDDDLDAPKVLTKGECALWKMRCKLLLEEKVAADSKAPALSHRGEARMLRRPKEIDPSPFCDKFTALHLVINDHALMVNVPDFATAVLFHPKYVESKTVAEPAISSLATRMTKGLFGKPGTVTSASSSSSLVVGAATNAVFDFFVNKRQDRNDFQLCLARYKDTLLFFNRKVLKYNESLFYVFMLSPKPSELDKEREKGFLYRIQDLVHQQTNMERFFEKEYKLIRDALTNPMSWGEKRVFMAYQNALEQAKANTQIYLDRLLSYWQDGLDQSSLLQSDSIETFKSHLGTLRR